MHQQIPNQYFGSFSGLKYLPKSSLNGLSSSDVQEDIHKNCSGVHYFLSDFRLKDFHRIPLSSFVKITL